MGVRKKALAAVFAALLAVPTIGVASASADWFNWYNGVCGSGCIRDEGINHHTYATENYSTGVGPCVGVSNNYYICDNLLQWTSIYESGYALGRPEGGNIDRVSHYIHLWWCSGAC
jgi:hypothetical protein